MSVWKLPNRLLSPITFGEVLDLEHYETKLVSVIQKGRECPDALEDFEHYTVDHTAYLNNFSDKYVNIYIYINKQSCGRFSPDRSSS